jgi:hypothetical protein
LAWKIAILFVGRRYNKDNMTVNPHAESMDKAHIARQSLLDPDNQVALREDHFIFRNDGCPESRGGRKHSIKSRNIESGRRLAAALMRKIETSKKRKPACAFQSFASNRQLCSSIAYT